MNYAKAIKTVRALREMEQRDLAKLLGVDASYISLIESGQRVPSTAVLEQIAKSFGVPLYLLVLLGSEPADLQGVSKKETDQLASQLLDVVLGTTKRRNARRTR